MSLPIPPGHPTVFPVKYGQVVGAVWSEDLWECNHDRSSGSVGYSWIWTGL